MPDDGRTSDEEKIILNGGTAGRLLSASASILDETCKTIYSFTEHKHFAPAEAKELVKAANHLEDLAAEYMSEVFKFQRKVLEGAGFTGPWPKSLQ